MRELNLNLSETASDRNDLAHEIIGAAIRVHRVLGMGLLPAAYKACLMIELDELGIAYEENVEFPLFYKNRLIEVGICVPLLVESHLLVDVQALASIHEEHVLTALNHLRHADLGLGLIINFNAKYIKGDAIKRVVNGRVA